MEADGELHFALAASFFYRFNGLTFNIAQNSRANGGALIQWRPVESTNSSFSAERPP
jgi:hypothetical protein